MSETSSIPEFARDFDTNYQGESPDFERTADTPDFDKDEDAYSSGAANPWNPSNVFHIFNEDGERPSVSEENEYKDTEGRFTYLDKVYDSFVVILENGETVEIKVINRQIYETDEGAKGREVESRGISGSTRLEITDPDNPDNKVVIDAKPRLDKVDEDASTGFETRKDETKKRLVVAEQYVEDNKNSTDSEIIAQVERTRREIEKLKGQIDKEKSYKARTQGKRNVLTAEIGADTDQEFVEAVIGHLEDQTPEMGETEISGETVPHLDETFSEQEEVADTMRFLLEAAKKNKYETPVEPEPGEAGDPVEPEPETPEEPEPGEPDEDDSTPDEPALPELIKNLVERLTQRLNELREMAQKLRERIRQNLEIIARLEDDNQGLRDRIEETQELRAFVEEHNPRGVLSRYVEVGNYSRPSEAPKTDAKAIWIYVDFKNKDDYVDLTLNQIILSVSTEEGGQRSRLDYILDDRDIETPGVTKEGLNEFKERVVDGKEVDTAAEEIFGDKWREELPSDIDKVVIHYGRTIQMGVILREMYGIVSSDHIDSSPDELTLNEALEQIQDLPTAETLQNDIRGMEQRINENIEEISRLRDQNKQLEEELDRINEEIRYVERGIEMWKGAEYATDLPVEEEGRGSAEEDSEEAPEHSELRDMTTQELREHLAGLRERIDHLERALVLMDAEDAVEAIAADPEAFGLEDGIPEGGIAIEDLLEALSALDEEDIPDGIDLEQFIQILNEILEDNEDARFFPEDDDSDPDNNIRIIINRMIEDNLDTLNEDAAGDEVITDPRTDRAIARDEIAEEISITGDEISEAEEILEERGEEVRSAEEQEANRQAAEQSVNELGGLLNQESEQPGFWRNLASNVAEVLVTIGGSIGVKTLVGAAVGGALTLTGFGAVPVLIAFLSGAAGGAVAESLISTQVRYRWFHNETHQLFTENTRQRRLTPVRNAINRLLIRMYGLPDRLQALAQAQETIGQLSAEDANQARLEDLGMTEQELIQVFQQLLMIRELTNYRGLEEIELPEGIQFEGESVEEALQRMGDVVMRIIGTHGIDVKEVAENAQQEARGLRDEALGKVTLINAAKGVVIGGIAGVAFHIIGELIGGGATAAEGAGRGAENMQNVDVSQMADTVGDQQLNTIQQWAADQGITLSDTQAEQIFERAAGADGVITGDEVGTLESTLNELGINIGDVTGGAEGWTMPRSGFWSYQQINENFTPDRVQAAGFRWDDTASNHGLFLGNSGEPLKNVRVLDQLREAGISQQDITPEAFAHVYHGGSVEDAVAMIGGDLTDGATAVDTSSLLGELRTMGDVYREAVKGAENITTADTNLGGQTLRTAAQTVRRVGTALGLGGLLAGTALHTIPAPDFETPGGETGGGDGSPGSSGGPADDDEESGTSGTTGGSDEETETTESDERGSDEDGGRDRSEESESGTEGTTAEETREEEEESDEPTILFHIGPNGEIFTGPLPNEIEGSRLEEYTTIEINPPSYPEELYLTLASPREDEMHIREWMRMQQEEWTNIAELILENQNLRVTDMVRAHRGDDMVMHWGSLDSETRKRNAERLKELIEEGLYERVETLQEGVMEQALDRLDKVEIDEDSPLSTNIKHAKRTMKGVRGLWGKRYAPSITMDYIRTMQILLDTELTREERSEKVRREIYQSAASKYQKVRGAGLAGIDRLSQILTGNQARHFTGHHPPGITYIVADLAYQSLGLDSPNFLSDLSLPESEPETRPGLNLEQLFRTVGHLELSSLELENNVINRLVNFLLENDHLNQAEAIFIVTGLDEDDISRLRGESTRRTSTSRRGRRSRSGASEADEPTTDTRTEEGTTDIEADVTVIETTDLDPEDATDEESPDTDVEEG